MVGLNFFHNGDELVILALLDAEVKLSVPEFGLSDADAILFHIVINLMWIGD